MYEDRIARLPQLPDQRRRRLKVFYDQAARRHNGEWAHPNPDDPWSGRNYTGADYRIAEHLYQDDLNILGDGSLFTYLATARTETGRRRLADFLLHPVPAEEARARQAAVRELSALPDLRESVATLGETVYSDCDPHAITRWLSLEAAPYPAILRPVALATSAALIVLLILGLTALVPWTALMSWMISIVALHVLLAGAFIDRTRTLLKTGVELGPEIAILQEGVTLLAGQSFQAPKLQALQQRAASMPRDLRYLSRLTRWTREREKEWFYGPSLYLFIGTQLALRLEHWRTTHGQQLREAIDIWSEFEALEALGTYAFEHPGDVYPEFCAAIAYQADDLGHPLLAEDVCVRNDVRFDDAHRFWIISGSNMAGKSTLLRSIGVSVVLALAGAPVRAKRLTLAPLRICASIGVPDSLLDGKSRFKAEVDKIRDSILAAQQAPTLFLIDEIFSGTNSHDRRIAAESVVKTLLGHGAIGALSTHDLALTEIATYAGWHGTNVHMCSRSDDDVLEFDYRVKPGVNRQSNALAIARLAGVPV